MKVRCALLALLVSLCACKSGEEGHTKVIIGAILLDGSDGPPLSDSIVVIANGKIRAAGARSTVPIPAESDKVDGAGKYIVPALIDAYASSPDELQFKTGHPATADAAVMKVVELAARKVPMIHLWKLEPAVAQATLERARETGLQAMGHASSQADVRLLVDAGVNSLVGMITDTEDIDSALTGRLRNLRIVYAPALAAAGAQLEIAKRNTLRLFQAGVPIAAASNGANLQRELELLADAGIPPLDVVVAATRNGAAALHQLDETGTVQAGKRADLLLLSASPGEDIHNLSRIALRISGGEWVR